MTRQELKARAKAQLGNRIFSSNWVTAVVVTLIYAAIISALNLIPIFGSIASFLILGPLMFGYLNVFVRQSREGGDMQIGKMFCGFEDFTQTFLILLMTSIFIFLWSLLLIVPGIIKSFSYSMVYYIRADHPDYNWNDCMKESMRIMEGHKMELFVLELSFIGWVIVGSLCLGVGILWVEAYMQATLVQFYESIKDRPIA